MKCYKDYFNGALNLPLTKCLSIHSPYSCCFKYQIFVTVNFKNSLLPYKTQRILAASFTEIHRLGNWNFTSFYWQKYIFSRVKPLLLYFIHEKMPIKYVLRTGNSRLTDKFTRQECVMIFFSIFVNRHCLPMRGYNGYRLTHCNKSCLGSKYFPY